MQWIRNYFVGVCILGSVSYANSSHLVLFSVGEGAIYDLKGKNESLQVSTFLPFETEIIVQHNSGLETLLAGYNFRFGHNTRFTTSDKGTQLKSGMIMIQSRKIDSACKMVVGNSSFSFVGSGTCILEYDGDKQIWITGILGRFRILDEVQSESLELMPGDLLSYKINGDVENGRVNLKEVISSSFLISGFKNNTSFQKSLDKVAEQQDLDLNSQTDYGTIELQSVSKIINEISEAKISDTNAKDGKNYSIPEMDPLRELLGRAPRRFGENIITPISEENSTLLEELITPVEESVETPHAENEEESKPRPFPSRLLRKNRLQNTDLIP